MKYLCLIYSDEKGLDARPETEWGGLVSECLAAHEELSKSGHVIASEALQPVHTATTVRVRNGKLSTTDGPFAETKEQLGGFYLIEARDLNEAIQVASRIPSARSGASRCGRSGSLARMRRGPAGCERGRAPSAMRATVDAVYRSDSRRVLATLIRLLGDFDLAEEALHDAFAAAVGAMAARRRARQSPRVARFGRPLQGDRRACAGAPGSTRRWSSSPSGSTPRPATMPNATTRASRTTGCG